MVPFVTKSQMLSPVAERPNWSDMEAMQESVTKDEFERLLNTVYAPKDAAAGLIEILPDHASMLQEFGRPERFILRFAKSEASVRTPPRFWRTRKEIGSTSKGKPMTGFRIALDPGHLGGEWARMEGRWYQVGTDTLPVKE